MHSSRQMNLIVEIFGSMFRKCCAIQRAALLYNCNPYSSTLVGIW